MEVQDRGNRVAWVVSVDGMAQIVDYIHLLEEASERDFVRAMLHARRNDEEWKSGSELVAAADAYFNEFGDDLMAAITHD